VNSYIDNSVVIGNNVKLGENVVIKAGCVLEDNITVENNVYIDIGTIVHSNVTIGENTTVGAQCILGEYLADFYEDRTNKGHPLIIGKNSLIRSESIIYGENRLGDYLQTGHRVTIREYSKIGEHVRIGTLSDIQGYCEIQDYVSMHSNVHIGMKSTIKKYAMLFPYVVLTNDPNPPSNSLLGVTIEEFAVVATGSIILPGKVIGAEALVGAGSVVTKDVLPSTIVFGNPAREHGETKEIKNQLNGEHVYPWKYTFCRGLPWDGIGYDRWMKDNGED
jgi:acetyltransferase-like isoleucine patch superfamily enzyme